MNPANPAPSAETLRYFTRAGRDPLASVDFVDREGVVMPAAWSQRGWLKLLESQPEAKDGKALIYRASMSAAVRAAEKGLIAPENKEAMAEELAFVTGRGCLAGSWLADGRGASASAVINLAPFAEPVTGRFDLPGLRQTIRLALTAAAAENEEAAAVSWTNLGGLLLAAGVPFDSPRGVGIGGCLAALFLGEAVAQSARLAQRRPEARQDGAEAKARLEEALASLNGLPSATGSAPLAVEPTRWRTDAEAALRTALTLAEGGILAVRPVSIGSCAFLEEAIDPASRGAEAIPSLDVRRPEFAASLKAAGLDSAAQNAALQAAASGKPLAEWGLPAGKEEVYRTGLDGEGMHPNAQIQMAAAVMPFVVGSLSHRLHMPGEHEVAAVAPPNPAVAAEQAETEVADAAAQSPAATQIAEEADAPAEVIEEPAAESPAVLPIPLAEEPVVAAEAPLEPQSPAADEEVAPAEQLDDQVESATTVKAEEAPVTEEPKAEETTAPNSNDAEEPQAATPEAHVAAEIVPASEAGSLAAVRRPSSTFEFAVQGRRAVMHALETEDGRLAGVYISSLDATGSQKSLLDAFSQAVTAGLQAGVPIDRFADEVRGPKMVHDALQVLKAHYSARKD